MQTHTYVLFVTTVLIDRQFVKKSEREREFKLVLNLQLDWIVLYFV